MTAEKPSSLVPKLRFPEFRRTGDWQYKPLSDIAEPISDRVGTTKCVPMSVTTGVGLVSQEEKFGRTIAGNSIKNYIRLQTNDFAYNKSSTKEFPQGYIARHFDTKDAAVPNSIFTCFRPNIAVVIPEFLDHLFHRNYHGRWLRKYITVGARAHGALSVSDDDFMSMPVPLPPDEVSCSEQRKIAVCLGSLDNLIAVEERKLEALRRHKQGLLQQLIPQPGEIVPRLRFPEFVDAPHYETSTFGERCESFSGSTPDTSNRAYYGGTIPFIRSAEIGRDETEIFLTEEGLAGSAAKMVNRGDLLVALYGANSGDTALARLDGAINQAIMCLRSHDSAPYLHHYLTARKNWIVATYLQGGQGNISGEIVLSLPLIIPHKDEQEKVADCLSSLDARIEDQAQRNDAIRRHKQGLLQQLFPTPEGS